MSKEKANFYYFALVYTVAFAVTMAGCATQNKSIGLGGGIGAGAGAVFGGIADPGKNGEYRTRNVIVGSALGGMAGMIAGSVIHDNTETQKQEAYKRGQASAGKTKPNSMPDLKSPKVDARWIEGRIIGNRYVEAHWEYVITEPARWEEN